MKQYETAPMLLGTQLSQAEQQKALSRFVHRFTRDHKPSWANGIWKNGMSYPVQFNSDQDWLAHTKFNVKENGQLSERHDFCESSPTWPDNPELRRA